MGEVEGKFSEKMHTETCYMCSDKSHIKPFLVLLKAASEWEGVSERGFNYHSAMFNFVKIRNEKTVYIIHVFICKSRMKDRIYPCWSLN